MSRSESVSATPPAPRFALAWAIAAYAAAAMTLGYPALAGRFLVSPVSDQYFAGYALREFAAHTLRTTGSLPLWNPYIFGGMPFVASMNGDLFYPTFLLRLVLPTDVAMTWSFILHVFLAGLFTHSFLRAWGLGFLPALVGGLAYMMGGPIAAYVSPGHDGKLYVSALLPLVLFLLVLGIRDGRRWVWGALAIVVGLAVLSPHPQLLQYMLLGAGAFALYLALAANGPRGLARNAALSRLALAAGAVLVGFAMGAVQYLPVMEYVPWSPRAGGLPSYEVATSYSFPPEELLNTYLPQFSGILDNYWGRNFIHLHSEYLGAVVLLLAGLGLLGARSGEKYRAFTWFWLATFVVALLWALGGFTPFYRIVYALVPGTKFFRAPSTMMFLMAFAVAVLAALGAERVAAKRLTSRYAIGWLIGAGAALVLGTTGALTNLAGVLAGEGRYEAALANGPQLALGAVRSFVFVALAAGALIALARNRVPAARALLALVVLVAADLWSVERHYWRFSDPASKLFASDSIIAFLKAQDQPARVLAIGAGGPTEAENDPVFRGDGLMPHRIRTVLGYHGNELGRYDALVDKPENYRQVGNPQLWRLLNMKYLLTNVAPSPIPGSRKILGPVKNAAGSTAYLYEMALAAPFAWVTPAIVQGPDAAVLNTVLDARFDISRAALFDSAAPVHGRQLAKLPDSTGITVRATHYAPGRIALELDRPAPEGSALVVSENFYPGWSATVDGKPAAIGRADFVLIGVALPAGARKVELAFASPAYEHGKMITLLALAFAMVLVVAGAVLDRRAARG